MSFGHAIQWLSSTLSGGQSATPRYQMLSSSTTHSRATSFASDTSQAASKVVNAAPTLARHSLRAVIQYTLPSFLHPSPSSLPFPSIHSSSNRPLPPTAYLDGLRGTAAFLVFIYHFLYAYFPSLEYGFLHSQHDTNPLQLPILRLIMCGASMVSIFFVISGYVLSYKSIILIRSQEYSSLLSTLSSSTFRRAIRLFIPTLISVIGIAVLIQSGAFTWASKHVKSDKGVIPGWREQDPPILSSFNRQMQDAFWAWARMSNPFIWKEYFITYDLHLWTIPVEFRCSILVFVSLLGLARVKAWVRMITLGIMAYTCMVYLDRWDVCLFLSGAVLAEITIIRSENASKGSDLLHLPILLLGAFIASQPSHEPGKTPGYKSMTAYTPKSVGEKGRFWPSVAAIIIVYALSSGTSRGLQRPFTTSFAQYLGKISYALYLVHGPVCRSLGYYSVVNLWAYTGKATTTGYVLGVLGGWILVFVTVFWVSDIFWRVFDVGCVKLARWVEGKCLVTAENRIEKMTR